MDGWKNVSVQKIESPVKENTKEIRKQGKKKIDKTPSGYMCKKNYKLIKVTLQWF